jgi:hypothetical protein
MVLDLKFKEDAIGSLYDSTVDIAVPAKVMVQLSCDDIGSTLSLGDLSHGIQISVDASKLMSFLIRNL